MKPRKQLRRHPGRSTKQLRDESLQIREALKEIDREAQRRRKRQILNWEIEDRISAINAKYERYLVASAQRQAKARGQS